MFIFYFIDMKVEEEEAGVGKLDPTNYRRRCQDQEGKQGHSEKLMQILRGSRLSLDSFITALSVGGNFRACPFPLTHPQCLP